MKIKTGILSESNIQTTGRSTKMKIDESAQAMIFKLFTGDLYSDPIGTVIREITSNCFDSHIEANVDTSDNPVIIELENNSNSDNQSYISFIDKGVGMSPDRVENIYGNYFKSTKRNTNTQIGGFGLGGKTPLAYTNSFYITTVSEKQNDIEFCQSKLNTLNDELTSLASQDLDEEEYEKEYKLVSNEIEEFQQRILIVSNFKEDRIEYVYNVFEGNETPEHQLISYTGTTNENGTIIRIPIKDSDIKEFETKTHRQLYYFENIIFKGFSPDSYVTNEYNIVRGETFLYRGDTYSGHMHVCLGKVAYPLDFNALGLEAYDYRIPVAIKLEIGELAGTGVTPSREALNYSPENRKIILAKIEQVKQELNKLLTDQYSNITTLSDYYSAMNDFGTLYFTESVSINIRTLVHKSDISLDNFKYNDLVVPDYNEVLRLIYTHKMYGKKSTRYDRDNHVNNFRYIKNAQNVYHVNNEFKRVVLKQSYLQYEHNRYYIYTPINLNEGDNLLKLMRSLGLTKLSDNSFDDYDSTTTVYVIPQKKAKKLAVDFYNDIKKIVEKHTDNYDTLEVPDEFIEYRKKEKLSKEVLKTTIPMKTIERYSGERFRIKFEHLMNVSGRIYYGFRDDEHELSHAREVMEYFDTKFISPWSFSNYPSKRTNRQGSLVVLISKQNEKYMKMLGKKAIHVKYFYHTFVGRKLNDIVQFKIRQKVNNDFEKINYMLLKPYMNEIDQEIYDMVSTVKNNLPKKPERHYFSFRSGKIKDLYGIDIDNDKKIFEYQSELDKLIQISQDSTLKLRMVNEPDNLDVKSELGKHFIGLLSFCIVK